MMRLYVENTIFTLKMSSVIYAHDLKNKSQFIAPLERMIYRWYDIPYGYDICVADDIRSAYGGVATPQIKIMGFRP